MTEKSPKKCKKYHFRSNFVFFRSNFSAISLFFFVGGASEGNIGKFPPSFFFGTLPAGGLLGTCKGQVRSAQKAPLRNSRFESRIANHYLVDVSDLFYFFCSGEEKGESEAPGRGRRGGFFI